MSASPRRPGRLRRRLARWLDPTLSAPVVPPAPAHAPAQPRPDDAATRLWPAMLEQFALRILSAVHLSGTELEAIEVDEQDPARLEQLYRIDHAITRVRRQAENMQVLAGHQVEDADRQITSLLDVVRAAASAIEHYPRIHLGRIAELAVVEYAADDVMRVLTELLDNATRYSPPTSDVVVSAHITEQGSVLLRVEDDGVGLDANALNSLNARLAGAAPMLNGRAATQLGLSVVARLAAIHRLRTQLTNRHSGGTTATVLLPAHLICEIPDGEAPPRQSGPRHQAEDDQPTHLIPVIRPDDEPAPGELPRRSPASLRDSSPTPTVGSLPTPPPPVENDTPWYDEIAAFAAGTADGGARTGGQSV